VTGGAGFLGSHLVDRLLQSDAEVLCVDNLFTGDKSNLDHLVGHPRFEFMRHDICFPLYVEVDQIYNLACPASPIHYQFDPVQTTKVSVIGSINMLGLAKRARADPAGINIRSVRRSDRSSAAGKLLGQRELYRSQGLL
jgi:UDP-glucuronate decarboxylase